MKEHIKKRALKEANHIICNNATVRATANLFGVSKSTTHIDVTLRLSKINPALYKKVRKVLKYNESVRHIRGGNATKEKYLKIRKEGDSYS